MTTTVVEGRVGDDGVLRLEVPFGSAEAGQTVRLSLARLPNPMTDDEWRAAVLRSAGSIPDPTFMRHPQDSLQERDPL